MNYITRSITIWQENDVLINGELDNRRGRKLYPNDLVEIPEYGKFMMEADK